jgi:nicotinamidase-related amidase
MDNRDMPVGSAFNPNAALMIIDVQNAMDSPVWGERNNPALVPNLQRVLERWRRLGWPVYFIADDEPNPDSPYHPGQPGNDFKAELSPIDGEHIVRKTTGSAFAGTGLEQRLTRAGHQTLVVGGFQTNKCVESAVRAARDLGFSVYVLADGTATVGHSDRRGRWWEADDVHNLALANMKSNTTRVIEVDELLSTVPAVD